MKATLILASFLLLATPPSPLAGQRRQVTIHPGRAQPAPPAQPEPGDVFRTDQEGNYIIERRKASGEIVRYRIVPRTKIDPRVKSELSRMPGGVRFSYHVTNGAAARQPIYWFCLPIKRADTVLQATAPPGWYLPSTQPADWSVRDQAMPYRLSWFAEQHRGHKPLGAGATVGPLVVEATALPGLAMALPAGERNADEQIIEVDRWDLSPWLLAKVNEVLDLKNDGVQVPVLAPRYPIAELQSSRKLADAIAAELQLAAGMPEFDGQRSFLEQTAAYVKTAGKAAAGLDRQFETMGTTPLERAFFRAMAINLRHLATLP